MSKKRVKESLSKTVKSPMTKSKKRNRNGKARTDKSKFCYDPERKT